MNRIIFFYVIIPILGFAQNTGTIKGFVTDSLENIPVRYALIVLEGTSEGAVTDTNGFYSVSNIESGYYNLVCSCPGYTQAKKENILVKQNSTSNCSFLINELYFSRFEAKKNILNGKIIVYMLYGSNDCEAAVDFAKQFGITLWYQYFENSWGRYNDEIYRHLDEKYGDGWSEQFLSEIFKICNTDSTEQKTRD